MVRIVSTEYLPSDCVLPEWVDGVRWEPVDNYRPNDDDVEPTLSEPFDLSDGKQLESEEVI